jgi:uncharacterized protein
MPAPLWVIVALALQSTPTGGAISKFAPPVPTPASFISDQRTVLTAAQRSALDARIQGIQAAGLGDIAVAILPSVGSYSPNQVAVEIYRTWKVGSVAAIGSARRNVGVLLLIVPKELAPDNRGHCWINTGLGAEGIITDATAGSICRDSIVPHLRTRDYAGAVGAGISAIEARLRADSGLARGTAGATGTQRLTTIPVEPARAPSKAPYFAIGGVLFAIIGAVGGRRWWRHHKRKCAKCGRHMRRLDESADDAMLVAGARLEEQLGSVDYDVWACDCGETKVIPWRAIFTKYSECPHCSRRAASKERAIIRAATTASTGLAEDRYHCKACNSDWIQQIILPQIVASSSSGGSSGGGGGGGGSSFGGSGSTSGGGGGSSY